MLRRVLTLGSFAVLAACSSSTDTTPTPSTTQTQADGIVGDVRADATWTDGTKLAGVVRIVEGITVTIAPGAKLTCTSNAAKIEIGGTLNVDSKSKHASISCDSWGGILVGANGSIAIDGLDISNASTGYETTTKAGSCSVKNSVIKASVRPFTVGDNSKLLLDHVDASVPTTVGAHDSSVSEINGTLEAHYLTYQAQSNEGIMLKGNGDATITDSTLKATGGQDLVSSYDGKSLKLSYTTMDGAHCGIHMQGISTATVDHVTSTGNLYGVTIYKADNFTISDSNLGGSVGWLDLQGDHGPVSLNNIFVVTAAGAAAPPNKIVTNTTPPVADTTATAQIADAIPHPDTTQ
jgi:hypothetical protein